MVLPELTDEDLACRAAQEKAVQGYRTWGRWILNPKTKTLDTVIFQQGNMASEYWIRLDRCGCEADRLEWFCHLRGKRWIHQSALYDLRRAFLDLIADGTLQK